jgi:hypothetical protein
MADDTTTQPDRDRDETTDDDSFKEEMENDPARNPSDDELKQIQGG